MRKSNFNFLSTDNAPIDGASQQLVNRLYTMMTPAEREEVASWELANQDELEAMAKNVNLTSWTEELAKRDRTNKMLAKVDAALAAVGIFMLLASPMWIGPVFKLLRSYGVF